MDSVTMTRVDWRSLFKGVGLYTVGAYVFDVVVAPASAAANARAFANTQHKPLLNIGAGTPGSSLRAALLGPTLWGDVNIDIAASRDVPHASGNVSYGDAHNLSSWPDKFFGAVIASHVLEHLDRPDVALREWERVADRLFIVVPKWWAPHTWLHPGHRWYVGDEGGRRTFAPLWQPSPASHRQLYGA